MIGLRARIQDERGIALVTAVLLMALLGTVAVSMMGLTSLESDRSRRDVSKSGAMQAAEAGLNVYTADLTEDTGYFLDYIAAGEARRSIGGVQYPTTAGANANANVSLSPSWARPTSNGANVWTYPSDITTDPGWRTLSGTNYQYLLEIYPNPTLARDVRVVSIGRPVPSSQNPASDKSTYRAVEALLQTMSISDFQMLSAQDISYGSTATTSGLLYATVDDNGNTSSINQGGTATADLLSEGPLSSISVSHLISPARKYANNSSPTIRSLIPQTVHFADLRQSQQIAPPGGGMGTIQLAATTTGINLNPSTNVPNAWWLKFNSSGTVDVYSCMKATSVSNGVTTYYAVEYKQPTCTLYQTYTLNQGGEDVYSTEDVIISGVVNGQVTIYTASGGVASSGDKSTAQGNVIIGGNLSYNQAGSDVLGAIATNNVLIACWQGQNNLSWRAATMSLNGAWESDQTINGSCRTSYSTMTFTGSTATYNGGGMGGYATRTYNYDPTLRYLPPPDYPEIPASLQTLYQREIPSP